MSRIGKKPIKIPEGVEIKIEKEEIFVKGPKGELSFTISPDVDVKIEEKEITVSEKKETKKSRAMWGTTRALISNMVEGVSVGYTKELQVKGVGYRAEMKGETLVLKVGFSHLVEIEKIEGVSFSVNKDIISVSGIKKDLVGRVAAEVRKVRPPEPYKGKGIRYKDEVIILKEGKKSAK
jgi:large subunit ribosomal protein L6